MKRNLVYSILLSATALFACYSARAQDGPMDSDKKFVMTASQDDLTEIKLSQLALQKGSDSKVKEFAQMMVKDHTQLENDMKPFAAKMGVAPADALNEHHQAEYDKLSSLSGTAFDMEYVKAMDIGHNLALMAFQGELATTKMSSESDFITTVAAGEKVVAEHTKKADKLEKEMGLPAIDPTSL